ncbi:MAG: HAMP domain-containing histidine kinase [Clostridiales bacterium]|nr:HAMP domain-containing histidine kinase [Clostridiales bacterium]
MLISLVVGRELARRIASPLAKTAEAAKQVSVGNYAHRFGGAPKIRELGSLADAVSQMAGALERQKSQRRQLTADIAHELRTPIAALSAHLETMIDGIWEPTPQRLQGCYEEITRLGGIVADLERLERLERSSQPEQSAQSAQPWQAGQPECLERLGQPERVGEPEQPWRAGQMEPSAQPERSGQSGQPEQSDRPERSGAAGADGAGLFRAPADLLEIARGVCASFEGVAAAKAIELSAVGEPSIVSVDKDKIAGAIMNLVSNALKHTPACGRIRVAVRDSSVAGAVDVEDTGAGIPECELPHIFERFYRADKSRNRDTGGTGLGLAIVKSAVAAHGGTVGAWSVEGRGSRFTVTLPKDGGEPQAARAGA